MWFPIHIFYMSFTDYGMTQLAERDQIIEQLTGRGIDVLP